MWELLVVERFNYWIYVILMMIGLYAMVAKTNMLKKLIGMSIFQTAIMLFYVSIGVKEGATIPILKAHGAAAGDHAAEAAHGAVEAAHGAAAAVHTAAEAANAAAPYANPLPHVLMLTAIVVGVATLGVAMAVVQRIYAYYGSIEEDEVLKKVKL